MKKLTTTASTETSAWDTPAPEATETKSVKPTDPTVEKIKSAVEKFDQPARRTDLEFDMEGLMTDFPTARELEKFVFDQTGVVLNLKGRSNKLKYQIALDVLNGSAPPVEVLGEENPYLDKNDIIPVDKLREFFPPCQAVQGVPMVAMFQSKQFPHPDPEWKASGQKCDTVFKKYANTVITYEIIGPVAARAVGVRVNKFGKEVPEKYTWIDPRTGEQVLRDEAGRLTPIGTRLKAALQRARVNKSDFWTAWVDRDFMFTGDGMSKSDSPWEV